MSISKLLDFAAYYYPHIVTDGLSGSHYRRAQNEGQQQYRAVKILRTLNRSELQFVRYWRAIRRAAHGEMPSVFSTIGIVILVVFAARLALLITLAFALFVQLRVQRFVFVSVNGSRDAGPLRVVQDVLFRVDLVFVAIPLDLVEYRPVDAQVAAAHNCGEGLFEFGADKNHVTFRFATERIYVSPGFGAGVNR